MAQSKANEINRVYSIYRSDPSEVNLGKLLELCRMRIVQRFHCEPDREDIAQNAILKLWQKIQNYDPERGDFAPFVSVVARTTRLDMRKKRAAITIPDEELIAIAERRNNPDFVASYSLIETS